ncbi:MAG TPA: FeoA family protein, partial [Flavisolibacter sp.]|nr:FeoA family protein [Flavisolibacter sp.]
NTSIALTAAIKNKAYQVVSFADTADSFLDYLAALHIAPGASVKITDQLEYDNSYTLAINKKTVQVSEKVARNILVQPAT